MVANATSALTQDSSHTTQDFNGAECEEIEGEKDSRTEYPEESRNQQDERMSLVPGGSSIHRLHPGELEAAEEAFSPLFRVQRKEERDGQERWNKERRAQGPRQKQPEVHHRDRRPHRTRRFHVRTFMKAARLPERFYVWASMSSLLRPSPCALSNASLAETHWRH